MKRLALATAAVAVIGTAIAIPVLADGNHGFGEGRSGARAGGMEHSRSADMMGGGMGQMMSMMQGLQNGMMGHGFAGSGPMMGGLGHSQALFDADNDGSVTPDELRGGLLEALKTYDADGNGNLSLDEFETMHTVHIREMTVDRFQALDADGDGQVTADEIAAPADRMERMMQRRADASAQNMPMMDGNNGQSMMNEN